MKQTSRIISTYSADTFGVCSALFELGGMTVMHDASGCNSTYTTHDEPRWYDMDSMVYISGLSEMEAILARGDRAVGKVLLNAYKKGSYFESWCEYFNPKIYDQAFLEEGVNKSAYTGAQDVDGLLPWDFIDVGVTKKFLQNERKKAYEGKVTGGCQTGCKGCGLQGRCNIK